jgi:phage shock protein A
MSSIKDALRVIAAEKRIEELGAALDELAGRVAELDDKVSALMTRPMPQSAPQPRPIERR